MASSSFSAMDGGADGTTTPVDPRMQWEVDWSLMSSPSPAPSRPSVHTPDTPFWKTTHPSELTPEKQQRPGQPQPMVGLRRSNQFDPELLDAQSGSDTSPRTPAPESPGARAARLQDLSNRVFADLASAKAKAAPPSPPLAVESAPSTVAAGSHEPDTSLRRPATAKPKKRPALTLKKPASVQKKPAKAMAK